jgi:putative component of toxin-antitoxin plasmid stabilization module
MSQLWSNKIHKSDVTQISMVSFRGIKKVKPGMRVYSAQPGLMVVHSICGCRQLFVDVD